MAFSWSHILWATWVHTLLCNRAMPSVTLCWHLFLIFLHSICSICRKQSSVTAMLHDLKSRCKVHSMLQNSINITLLMNACDLISMVRVKQGPPFSFPICNKWWHDVQSPATSYRRNKPPWDASAANVSATLYMRTCSTVNFSRLISLHSKKHNHHTLVLFRWLHQLVHNLYIVL